ncbi:nucleoside phosphorylase domain-containing protein [Aspergillus floccosus]
MRQVQPLDRCVFDIAVVCALREESDAVEAAFDCFLEDDELYYEKVAGDPNSYTFGKIGAHHVVLAYMPGMGKASSASLAASFRASFPNIQLGMVVGICGEVPQPDRKEEIFLGDVIVSTGVVQLDFERQYADQFGDLARPNSELRAFLHQLQGWRARGHLQQNISRNISEICGKEGFASWARPTAVHDRLYRADYDHIHRDPRICSVCAQSRGSLVVCERARISSCEQIGCDQSQLIQRKQSTGETAAIHFGRIASSDQVMKSAADRDRIANQEDIVAFEMEGAGVWDNFPTIIVKGVCDYADGHKNKQWQKYASVTAAACAKALLREWRVINSNITSHSSTRMAEGHWPEAGAAHDFSKGVVFNNHAQVANQGVHQNFHGNVSFYNGYERR